MCKCRSCLNIEEEFYFGSERSLCKDVRKKSIKSYDWRRPNTLKFTGLMSSENEI